ncbi:MAG: hypothetical protein H0U60_02650, partial [Blastocatellia bacterium]|nr:hypothetical protein [Blastocatellia bacterium]
MLIEVLGDSTDGVVLRVLHVDPTGTDVAVIDVDSPVANPVWHKASDLLQSLSTNEARVLEKDHMLPPLILEDEIPKKAKRFRDSAWESIKPLFEGQNRILMLFPHERGRLILQRVT